MKMKNINLTYARGIFNIGAYYTLIMGAILGAADGHAAVETMLLEIDTGLDTDSVLVEFMFTAIVHINFSILLIGAMIGEQLSWIPISVLLWLFYLCEFIPPVIILWCALRYLRRMMIFGL